MSHKKPGLTPKQKAFVREYCKHQNALRAAIDSGYSKKTAGAIGHENLKKPEIKKAIAEIIDKRDVKLDISAERILAEIASIAFLDVSKTEKKKRPFFKSTDKVKSLELLAKHKKLLTDMIEQTGKDGGPVQVVITLPDNGFSAPSEKDENEPA